MAYKTNNSLKIIILHEIKHNYTLESTSNPFGGFCKIKIYEIDIGKVYNKPNDVYRGINEVEAIIKACEWILSEVSKWKQQYNKQVI